MKHADLVYDVGMHRGEDTDFYLKKGFRVVAFEADPELVRHCSDRFADAVRAGRLQIVSGAVLDGDALRADTVRFFRNLDASVWGTADAAWMRRNEALGTRSMAIDVPVVDFAACLERYGVPHYLKVDIEGADLVCLRALLGRDERPDFLSVESEKVSFDRLLGEFDLLEQLGYRRFQAVQQATVPRQHAPQPAREGAPVEHAFPYGASGLFGEELPGTWQSRAAVLKRYRRIFLGYRLLGDRSPLARFAHRLSALMGRDIPGWYDTHARR